MHVILTFLAETREWTAERVHARDVINRAIQSRLSHERKFPHVTEHKRHEDETILFTVDSEQSLTTIAAFVGAGIFDSEMDIPVLLFHPGEQSLPPNSLAALCGENPEL
jgi:hypothetical protein